MTAACAPINPTPPTDPAPSPGEMGCPEGYTDIGGGMCRGPDGFVCDGTKYILGCPRWHKHLDHEDEEDAQDADDAEEESEQAQPMPNS